jgi:hypothetical protein
MSQMHNYTVKKWNSLFMKKLVPLCAGVNPNAKHAHSVCVGSSYRRPSVLSRRHEEQLASHVSSTVTRVEPKNGTFFRCQCEATQPGACMDKARRCEPVPLVGDGARTYVLAVRAESSQDGIYFRGAQRSEVGAPQQQASKRHCN